MRKKIANCILGFLCLSSSLMWGQNSPALPTAESLFEEGRNLFNQKNYGAAIHTFEEFLRIYPQNNHSEDISYMLVCAKHNSLMGDRAEQILDFLDNYPDSPHFNHLQALLGITYFEEGDYEATIEQLGEIDPSQLEQATRDRAIYCLASAYLETGNLTDAAIWFETLRLTGRNHLDDCTFYIGYIRYTQKRYSEAKKEFAQIADNDTYSQLVPFYQAEILLLEKNFEQAASIATDFIENDPSDEHVAQMHRILGATYYYRQNYQEAIKALEFYVQNINFPRHDATYMLGMSYFQAGVYTKAADAFSQVVLTEDEISQNAYLHLGLTYLQLAEQNQARMAFEQAAKRNTDQHLKELAAYNYALCIHETSYSAFGESVKVFENFLNNFPNSDYADRVSNYLIDVYSTTRSYDIALQSIERIKQPNTAIHQAKVNLLFQLGAQSFANAKFDQSLGYFNKALAHSNRIFGQKGDVENKLHIYYWRGENHYRNKNYTLSLADFSSYLRLCKLHQKATQEDMYALAHYNIAYIKFHQNKYPEALNYFQQFAKLEKQNEQLIADAYNRMADCNLHQRQYKEAAALYRHALSYKHNVNDYSFYQLALVAGMQRNYMEKVSYLDLLIEKYPLSPYLLNAWYEKGRAYVQLSNNAEAIEALKKLVAHYPEKPISRKASAEIGLLYYQDNNYSKAIEAYRFTIQKYPGSEEAQQAMVDLKSIYVDMNQVEQFAELAASMPQTVHFKASEQDSLTYIAAEKVFARKDITKAKESFNRYLQAYPQGAFNLNAHYYLCLIGKKENDNRSILNHAAQLLKFPDNPFSEETLLLQAEVQAEQKDWAAALRSYQMLKDKATTANNKLTALTGILHTACQLKNNKVIIESATQLLNNDRVNPELSTDARYERAQAYIRLQQVDKAMADLEILAKDTRHIHGAEAKYLVAQFHYDKGTYDIAEKQVLEFIEQSTPHSYWLARSFILLADIYFTTDKKIEARQYLLSLQENYSGNDDIATMIEERLANLNM